MDDKRIIESVILGCDKELYNKLAKDEKNNSLDFMAITYNDGNTEFEQYDETKYSSREEFFKTVESILQQNGVTSKNAKIEYLFTTDRKIKKLLKQAEATARAEELGATNVKFSDEALSEKQIKMRRAVATGIAVLGIGAITLTGCSLLKNSKSPEIKEIVTEETTEVVTEETNVKSGFGYYSFDLSNYNNLEEYLYDRNIPASYQKDASSLRLKAARGFNKSITLEDGTKTIGGLTTRQLVALQAYGNSNKYTKEDYIKTYGLYDFSSISHDLEIATLNASAYLADKNVDGKELAVMIEDEKAKEFFLKLDALRVKVLNAKDNAEKNKTVKEINSLLADTMDGSKDSFIDFSKHPWMSFIVSAEVVAIDSYNNIVLDKDIIHEQIIIGNDDNQSKIDSICADANVKLRAAEELKENLKMYLDTVDRETLAYENLNDNDKFAIDNCNPESYEKLGDMEKAKVDAFLDTPKGLATLVVNNLCSQDQINLLTEMSLAKDEKLVTEESQSKILQNIVVVMQKAIVDGSKGFVKDEHTAKLASQLQKVGDKVVETQKGVEFKAEDGSNEKLEQAAPEETGKAQEKAYEGTFNHDAGKGTIETDKKHEEEDIAKAVQQQLQKDTDNVNKIVDSYTKDGANGTTPSEAEYLPENVKEAAKDTGTARNEFEKATGQEATPGKVVETGGQITINEEYKDKEITDISTNPNTSEPVNQQPTTDFKDESVTETTTTTTVTTPTNPVVFTDENGNVIGDSTTGLYQSSEPTASVSSVESGTVVSVSNEPVQLGEFGGDIVFFEGFEDYFNIPSDEEKGFSK